jgi:hypothetical protein
MMRRGIDFVALATLWVQIMFVVARPESGACQGNLVFAAASGYTPQQLAPFVESYRFFVGHNATLLLLLADTQKDNPAWAELRRYLRNNGAEIEFTTVPQGMGIGNYRFRWLSGFLGREHRRGRVYCNVLATDSRDAFFQGDFFAVVTAIVPARYIQRYVMLSQEADRGGKSLASCKYHTGAVMRPCFQDFIKNSALDQGAIMARSIICSGSITGSHVGMMELAHTLANLMETRLPPQYDCLKQGLTDQLMLNILYYSLWSELLPDVHGFIPDNLDSPTFTLGYTQVAAYHVRARPSGGVKVAAVVERINSTIRVPPYIHQYDRPKHAAVGDAVRAMYG